MSQEKKKKDQIKCCSELKIIDVALLALTKNQVVNT